MKDNRKNKNPAAVALGRLGGRAPHKYTQPRGFATMTKAQRREAGQRGGLAKARNRMAMKAIPE